MRHLFVFLLLISTSLSCNKDDEANSSIPLSTDTENLKSNNLLCLSKFENTYYGRVWEDLDGDGLQDYNEEGLQGFTVLLIRSSDNKIVDNKVTNLMGEYVLITKTLEKHYIKVNLPNNKINYIASDKFSLTINIPNLGTIDTDITNENGSNTSSTLYPGSKTKLDFGYYKAPSINGCVWYDGTPGLSDNIYDKETEGKIPDFKIKLYRLLLSDESETLIDSTITDLNGSYTFDSLMLGSYIIETEVPDFLIGCSDTYGFVNGRQGGDNNIDSDIVETFQENNGKQSGITSFIDIVPNENKQHIDIGIRQTNIIEKWTPKIEALGNIWIDQNRNNIKDPFEPNMPSVTISLIDAKNSMIISQRITDESGYYHFENIGNRGRSTFLEITLPSNYVLVQDLRSKEDVTSRFDQHTRRTEIYRTIGCPDLQFNAGLWYNQ